MIKYVSWGISSAGRAPALHAGGQRFDPAILHHFWLFAPEKLTCVLKYVTQSFQAQLVQKSDEGPIAQLVRVHP